MSEDTKLSFFKITFWDLWLQKIFRNFASVKYQWMSFMFIMTIYGMLFAGSWVNGVWVAKIPPTLGMSFLGGGFVTLAISRVYVKTRLTESEETDSETFNTDE